MKALLTLLLAVCFSAHADDWTTEQKALGAIALTATVVDYGQTRGLVLDHRNEGNRVLGKHPSMGKVNAYFAAVSVLGYLVADNLSSDNRTTFLVLASGIEIYQIGQNKYLGCRIAF
jgi:uncharacterized protein YfiM (DUF2279 family)